MATTDKYDRQLRLWGAEGQRALANTCVVLLRASAVGTETVKNLVLPGVGQVLIVDDDHSAGSHYSSNFFITNDPTKAMAQLATELLQELNPDVRCSFKRLDSLSSAALTEIFSSIEKKIIVVASDLETPLLLTVSSLCDKLKIPLLAVASYGLIGILRIQTPPLALFNPKPRDFVPDLRLVDSLPALELLADSIDYSTLDDQQHSHVPYPLILLRAVQEWKKDHNGMLPKNFDEKQLFSSNIQRMSRNFDDELNFREAKANAYLAYTTKDVDLERLAYLKDTSRENLPELHALIQGLELFHKRHSRVPVAGTIPDMTASTELYIKLQTIYLRQAEQDINEMRQLVSTKVHDYELHAFCQNIFDLDIFSPRNIYDEYHEEIPDYIVDDLASSAMEGDEQLDQMPLKWYLAFHACQRFFERNNRYPGTIDDYSIDVPALQECLVETVKHYKLDGNEEIRKISQTTNYAAEMTRYANAEIHNIASVVGGVASQEAVKIITGQYTPLDNTYVYNGVASVGGVYRF